MLRPDPDSSPRDTALALARAAANGDTAATTRLLRLVAPEMQRVVRGVLGPTCADVDDALQQALVELVHALPSFRGECAPAGFACRIAFRTALAVRKRGKVARSRRDSDADLDAVPDSKRPDRQRESQARVELLRTLLDELPPEQAEALALRTMMGWALEEIAAAAGSPLNTIRSRLRLAKEALKRRIESDPALLEALGVEP